MLKRNRTIAGVLAFFLGTIGIHKFYMGEYKKGLLYLLFFWTGVPTILGIMDGAVYLAEDEGEGVSQVEQGAGSPVTSEKSESTADNDTQITDDSIAGTEDDSTADEDTKTDEMTDEDSTSETEVKTEEALNG